MSSARPPVPPKPLNTTKPPVRPLIATKAQIASIAQLVDSRYKLDALVLQALAEMATDFVESAVSSGCTLAQHRGSMTLETKDVLFHLDKTWSMRVPGYSPLPRLVHCGGETTDAAKERWEHVVKCRDETE